MVGYLVLVVLTLIPPQLFYVLTSPVTVKKVSQVEDRGEQLAHNIQKLTIKQYTYNNDDQYLHLSCTDEPGGRAGPGGTTTLCTIQQ